jgi:hypothetical protein
VITRAPHDMSELSDVRLAVALAAGAGDVLLRWCAVDWELVADPDDPPCHDAAARRGWRPHSRTPA